MTCSGVAKPDVVDRPSNIFGAPLGQAGRTFDSVDYGVQGIVLHCTDMTISQYVNYIACLTQPVNGGQETNHHYSIGSSGALNQHIDDGNISWTFGNYNAASYPLPPIPTITINWPTLQAANGASVSPDVYVINIVIAKSFNQATTCLTSSGLPNDQHEKLIQLLAYLSETYSIPLDADHINWHDNIATQACPSNECNCTDIACLLADINSFCETECNNVTYSEVSCESVSHLLAIPGDCSNSSGCLVSIPFDNCCFGHLFDDGDIEQFLGCAVDDITGQVCLVKNSIQVTSPITGDGTTLNPLALDLCAFGAWIPDGVATQLVGIDNSGCLIQSDLVDIVAGNETPLTVVDTDSVNLTASGTSNHTLQADVNISAESGNQLSLNPDGLFVDFNCVDFTALFEQDTLVNLYGTDAQGECAFEDAETFVGRIICDYPIDDGTPLHLLGRNTDMDCPVFFTPTQLVTSGLSVLDTTTIDLTLVDGVLSGDVAVSAQVDNTIQILGDGLYVPQLIPNSLSDCLTVDITNGQLNIDLVISSDLDNIVQCNANGLYVQDLTVVDDDCIDLTYDSITRQLTAALTIAGTINNVDNVVTCVPGEGLYVPRGANPIVNGPLIGLGTADNPLDVDYSLLDNEDLCDLGGVIPYDPSLVDVIGRDGAGCLRRYTGEEFIAQFLEVLDTDCVDLTLNGNVLSADPVISPAIGGIINVLSCTDTGLYVPQGGGITPQATNCVDLQLVNGVLTSTIIFSADAGNQVTCNVDGLFVPQGAGVAGGTTDCIQVVVTDGVIEATPIISGAILGVGNEISCEPGGLFVGTGAGLNGVSSDCLTVNFNTATGDLTVEPIISPLVDNIIQCTANGFYVPASVVPGVASTDCIDLAIVNDNIEATPIIDPDLNNILTCGANGLLAEIEVTDTNCIDLTVTNGVLSADVVIDPDVDNILSCGANGLIATFTSTVTGVDNTDCIDLTLAGGIITAEPILAPDQGPLTNVLQCIPGQGMFVPIGAGIATLDSNCIDLTLLNGVLTADIIIDTVQPNNQVECAPDGLFVPQAAGAVGGNTNCIEVNVTNGIITANPVISPAIGGIDNILTCTGTGLYVPQDFITTVIDSNCINLDVTNGILTANPILSATPDNSLQCLGDGLYVADCCPQVTDTNTVDLTLTGTNTISADVIIDPDPTNALVENVNGLFVPEDFIQSVNDTPCITLDVTGGVLTATPTIDPAVDNTLTCGPNGLYSPQLTVVDTNCIDLDITGNVLTANPILSATAGNQLQCLGDGLYVPIGAGTTGNDTDCISVTVTNGIVTAEPIVDPALDNQLTCGINGLFVPEPLITATDNTNCIMLSETAGVLTADPIIDPDPDNLLSCGVNGLLVEPMTVIDSGCIDLDFTANVLTANPNISATAGNQIQCLGDGFYVPLGAGITGNNTDCISVDVTNGIVTATPIIDPDLDNQLQCLATGLFVPEPFVTAVNNTNCISLDVTTGVLTANPVIDPAIDNTLTCGPNGLYSPQLTVVDTNCIDLDITGNVLTANPVLSATANNQINCLGDGLFVPLGAGVTGGTTDCINVDVTNGVITATPVVDPNLENQLQCLATGLFVPEPFITGIADTNCIDLTETGGILTANPVISPDAGNQIQCLGNGLFVPQGADLQVLDTDCLDLDVTNGVISGQVIFAPDQGGITNVAQCIPGQGFYVPAGAGLTEVDSDCIDLTITNGNVLQADIIISPDANNQVVCQANGLFVPFLAGLTVADTDCIDLTLTGGQLTADPIISPAILGTNNSLTCEPSGLFVPEIEFIRNIGATPAGGNFIDVDINGDGVTDFQFCEGFDTIVSTNDCVTGVGPDYSVTVFEIADKTLTIESAPNHTSLNDTLVVNSPGGIAHPASGANNSQVIHIEDDLVFTNPSNCRSMNVTISLWGNAQIEDISVGAIITTEWMITVGGANTANSTPSTGADSLAKTSGNAKWSLVLAPGASVTIGGRGSTFAAVAGDNFLGNANNQMVFVLLVDGVTI